MTTNHMQATLRVTTMHPLKAGSPKKPKLFALASDLDKLVHTSGCCDHSKDIVQTHAHFLVTNLARTTGRKPMVGRNKELNK